MQVQDDWLDKAIPAITERTERYANTEIRFNLMAVIKNREDAYNQELQSLLSLQDKIQLRMSKEAGGVSYFCHLFRPILYSYIKLSACMTLQSHQVFIVQVQVVEMTWKSMTCQQHRRVCKISFMRCSNGSAGRRSPSQTIQNHC